MPWITWFYRTTNNKLVLCKSTNQIESLAIGMLFRLVGDGRPCRERICRIHLPNYTRHDPNIIECLAETERFSRISKIFKIDVFRKHFRSSIPSLRNDIHSIVDPPKIFTDIRTLTKIKSIDVQIECSSIGNPLPSINWFDENQQEILDSRLYTIEQSNRSSILSFSVYSKEHSKVLYYCRSKNFLGTIEKLINISGMGFSFSLPKEFHQIFSSRFYSI